MAKARHFLVATVAAVAPRPSLENVPGIAGFTESSVSFGTIRSFVRYGMGISNGKESCMKLLRVSISVFVVACAANAWAQYGLYGAPDLVRLQPATLAPEGFVAPSGYQTEPPANGAPLNVAYSPATTIMRSPWRTRCRPHRQRRPAPCRLRIPTARRATRLDLPSATPLTTTPDVAFIAARSTSTSNKLAARLATAATLAASGTARSGVGNDPRLQQQAVAQRQLTLRPTRS